MLDSAKVTRLLREAHERLALQTHPDPYIHHSMPGGSSFMRNPALPVEALYPDGIPEGISRYMFLFVCFCYNMDEWDFFILKSQPRPTDVFLFSHLTGGASISTTPMSPMNSPSQTMFL